jgi:hypothetical protein
MSGPIELLPSLRLLSRVATAIPLHEYGFVVAGGIVPLLYRERDEARPPSTPVLCRKERDQAKRPKDLAYIYDVAVTTSADRCRDRAREVVARAMAESDEWRKWLDRGLRGLDELFATGTATGPLEVREVLGGAMPAGAVPSGAAISAVVRAWVAGVRGV